MTFVPPGPCPLTTAEKKFLGGGASATCSRSNSRGVASLFTAIVSRVLATISSSVTGMILLVFLVSVLFTTEPILAADSIQVGQAPSPVESSSSLAAWWPLPVAALVLYLLLARSMLDLRRLPRFPWTFRPGDRAGLLHIRPGSGRRRLFDRSLVVRSTSSRGHQPRYCFRGSEGDINRPDSQACFSRESSCSSCPDGDRGPHLGNRTGDHPQPPR